MKAQRMDYGPSHSLKGALSFCAGALLSADARAVSCTPAHHLVTDVEVSTLAPPDSQFPRLTDLRRYSDSSSSSELERRKDGIKPLCLPPVPQLGGAFGGYNITKSCAWCLA